MAKRSRQAVSSQSLLTVDAAFQLALKHFGNRRKAVPRLKEVVLWGSKDDRWSEIDMDRYGLYIGVYQTPDGWHAEVKMQPGRIGIADFDAYKWAFAVTDLNALCKSVDKDKTLPGATRGPKVKFDWPVFQAEFYCRLDRDAVGPHDKINVEERAAKLITWGGNSKDIGEKNTPKPTAIEEKVAEWMVIWRRKPKS